MFETIMPKEKDQETWAKSLAPYQTAELRRSILQLLASALLYVLCLGAMLYSLNHAYWITLLLAVPTAGFLVRLFMIQHDCGHGAFFASRTANNILGFLLGVLSLTPYAYWRKTHAIHHATSGNLDRRGLGDIQTLTVKEYFALPALARFGYRLYRTPIVMFLIGPAFHFIVKHRFPWDLPASWRREWRSIHLTNLVLALIVCVGGMTLGWQRFVLLQLPVTLIASTLGVWLFYVQHQYAGTYWRSQSEWDYHAAALQGSSHYDLPPILRWLTANIGLHHIHHLNSRIPNYKLQQCYDETPALQQGTRLTLWKSLRCPFLKLWDEERQRLVGFRQARQMPQAPETQVDVACVWVIPEVDTEKV